MRRILVTKDGTLVNPLQITTAKRALDGAAYQKDWLANDKGIRDLKAAENKSYYQDLEKAFWVTFPKGKPEMEDYYRTQVRLSDGQILWVDDELDDVKDLMERS